MSDGWASEAPGDCNQCGHPWTSHPKYGRSNRCFHRVWRDKPPHFCGCPADTPEEVERGRRDAAAWNAYMGRTATD